MTIAMPELGYLDDKPIYENDRKLALAYERGGKEEEKRVREEIEAAQKEALKPKKEDNS